MASPFDDESDPITPDAPGPQAPQLPGVAAAPPAPDPSGITPDPVTPDSAPADTVAPWRRSLAALVRGASNIGGRIIGGGLGALAATPADVVGGPAPTIAGGWAGESLGGGVGSSIGEYLAEKLEGRSTVNPYEVAGEGALGAIPIPGAGGIVKSALAGGALSAADPALRTAGHALAGDQTDINALPGQMESAGLWGAAGGAALHALGNAIKARINGAPAAGPVTPSTTVEGEPAPGVGHTTLPAASAARVTRAGQIQGLDPTTFRSVRGGAPAQPAPPPLLDRAQPAPVFNAIDELTGPTANSPSAIGARALGVSSEAPGSLSTGNPDLDTILGGSSPATADPITPDVAPEPLELPTRDTEGTEHYDVTPPALKQMGLDLSGTTDQGDLAPVAPVENNASGAPGGGSMEEISRTQGMRGRGETFVTYDRGGQRRVIGNDPGAQDYAARPGETFGVESPNGFQPLDDQGGRVPPEAMLPSELRDAIAPEMYHGLNDQPMEPDTYDLGGDEAPEPTSEEDAGAIPQPIADLYAQLTPQWDAALAAQEGDDIPFTVDPHESLPDFAQRIMTAPPSELMGGERKVRALLDAMKDEAGSAAPSALAPLAAGGVGGLAGAALDPDHPLKGAVTGAIAGTGLTLALQHPEAAEALRYFGLFGSPITVGKKALGDVGAAVNAAYEHAVGGDLDTAKSILSQVFSPQTALSAIDHFRNADVRPEIEEAVGPTAAKVIGAPSRALGAITQAVQEAHQRAGLSPEEAAALTYSGEPESAAGKAIVNLQREGGPLVRLAMPTAKVMTNIAEKNFQTMPGVGALPLLAKLARGEDIEPGEIGKLTARQLAGFLIGAAAYARGGDQHKGPESTTQKLEHAVMAPYAMTDAMGEAIGAALHGKPNPHEGPGMRAYNAAKAAVLRDLPVPTGADLDPRQWASEFIPNGLQELSTYAPSQYEQSDPLDALIAKIPLLNDMMLTPKRAALKGPQ